MNDFSGILLDLVRGYFTFGFYFFIVHAFLILLILGDSWLLKIRKEARALGDWHPGKPAEFHTNTTRILDRFVKESESLGGQGLFVPMTDFSDRLDSVVDGMISELYNRTNLLLLVGIAGTLFGVFEFATRSGVTLRADSDASIKVVALGQILAESMSKAFPVGFAGLVLTFVFQTVASFPEKSLRQALSDATQKALKHREAVTRSQAGVLQEAATGIQDSLAPLKDLRATLSQSLQPVVEELGRRLGDSIELIRMQFDRIEGNTRSMQCITASLEKLVVEAPIVIRQVGELQDRQRELLEKFRSDLEQGARVSADLFAQAQESVKKFGDASETLIQTLPEHLNELTRSAIHGWESAIEGFGREMSQKLDESLEGVRDELLGLRDGLRSASEDVGEASRKQSEVFQKLAELPDSLVLRMDGVFSDLTGRSLELWQVSADRFHADTQHALQDHLVTVSDATILIKTSLVGAAEGFERVSQNALELIRNPVDKAVESAVAKVESALNQVDQLFALRYPDLIRNADGVAAQLRGTVGQINDISGSLKSTIDAVKVLEEQISRGFATGELARRLEAQAREITRIRELVESVLRTRSGAAEGGGILRRLRRLLGFG